MTALTMTLDTSTTNIEYSKEVRIKNSIKSIKECVKTLNTALKELPKADKKELQKINHKKLYKSYTTEKTDNNNTNKAIFKDIIGGTHIITKKTLEGLSDEEKNKILANKKEISPVAQEFIKNNASTISTMFSEMNKLDALDVEKIKTPKGGFVIGTIGTILIAAFGLSQSGVLSQTSSTTSNDNNNNPGITQTIPGFSIDSTNNNTPNITEGSGKGGDGDKEKLNPIPTVKIVNGEVVFTESAQLPGNILIVKNMQNQLKGSNPYLFGVYNDIATRVVINSGVSEFDKLTTVAVLYYNLNFGRTAEGVDKRASGSNPSLEIYKRTLPKKDREIVDNIMRTHDNIAANKRKGRFMSMEDRDELSKIYSEYGKLTGDDMNNYLLTMFDQMIKPNWEKTNFMEPNNLINNFTNTKSNDELDGMFSPMSGALETKYYSPTEIGQMTPAKLVDAISILAKEIALWASKEGHNPSKPHFVSKAEQKRMAEERKRVENTGRENL